jgi:hypothetical protein
LPKIEVQAVRGELSTQVSDLLERDVLEHPAARTVARLVAEGGLAALTLEHRYIYEWHIKPHLQSAWPDEDPECIIF